MPLASEHMPLLDRLHKGANCVIFLDGAPEPAADVADMLRKAAAEIVKLRAALREIAQGADAKAFVKATALTALAETR